MRHLDKRHPIPQRRESDAHPIGGLGVLDLRLYSGDIVRLWTIPVSVSLAVNRRWLVRQEALAAVGRDCAPGRGGWQTGALQVTQQFGLLVLEFAFGYDAIVQQLL